MWTDALHVRFLVRLFTEGAFELSLARIWLQWYIFIRAEDGTCDLRLPKVFIEA